MKEIQSLPREFQEMLSGGCFMNRNQLLIQHGDDPAAMTSRLLERGNMSGEIKPGSKVGLKPNLVMAKPASSGATTHVSIVRALVESLQSWGVKDITIMESAWVGDSTTKAFQVCGYADLARETGIKLLDLKDDRTKMVNSRGLQLKVCRSPLEVDFLINLPVLKGHCQTLMTCALKNMKGCIPDDEKSRYHTIGLHRPIAALNTVLRQKWILVDALNGDLTYEGGGSPVPLNRLVLAKDPVLVDAWGAALMGYEPGEIEYLKLAGEWGVGVTDLSSAEILEEGKARAVIDTSFIRGDAAAFKRYIDERQACSACYASLIHALRRLQEQGRLAQLEKTLAIGQGFKGIDRNQLGIGSCTAGMDTHLPGCPPDPRAILAFLSDQLSR
jgi:uncharacterized protein (DUF362 family)